MKYIRLLVFGMLVGTAELIPGVGGSLVALIIGIYDDFINLLHGFTRLAEAVLAFLLGFKKSNWQKLRTAWSAIDWQFCILLITGAALAFVICSPLVTYVLENYASYLYAFMFGIVIASLAIPFAEIKQRKLTQIMLFAASFIIVFLLLGQRPAEVDNSSNLILLFFVGFIVAMAFALPGISASFLLVLFGVYKFIIDFVHNLANFDVSASELSAMAIFGLGVGLGFWASSHLLKWAFTYQHDNVMAVLLGFMAASLRPLFPFQLDQTISGQEPALRIVLVILGIGLILLLRKLSQRELERLG